MPTNLTNLSIKELKKIKKLNQKKTQEGVFKKDKKTEVD